MQETRNRNSILFLSACVLVFFLADLLIGSVYIPAGSIFDILTGGSDSDSVFSRIVLNFRLPKAITACLAGAALSVCGLLMQTLFRNPLAGPFVLGINSGASLGVAIVLLSAGISSEAAVGAFTKLGIIFSASIGAGLILLLVVLVSKSIKDSITLLILGLMFGHITSAIEGILQYFSRAESLQGFIIWSLGSFSNVVWDELAILAPFIIAGIVTAFYLSKPLNALLLGENYANSMGVNVKRSRTIVIIATGVLAGSITAFCGPIAFLGIAVPHLTRNLLNTSDHKILIPTVCLTGATLALICDVIAQMPGTGRTLPVNAVTSLFGAPVVIWVILRQRKRKFSF